MVSALKDVLKRDALLDGSLDPALARPNSCPTRLCFTVDSFLFCGTLTLPCSPIDEKRSPCTSFPDGYGALCPLDVCEVATPVLGLANAQSTVVKGTPPQRVAFKVVSCDALRITALDQGTPGAYPGIAVVVHSVAADYWLLEPHPSYRVLHTVFLRKLFVAYAITEALSRGITTYQAVLEQLVRHPNYSTLPLLHLHQRTHSQ